MQLEFGDILPYILGIILALIIYYNVLKSAIRGGIRDALKDLDVKPKSKSLPENPPTDEQIQLQQRYNNGEMTFAEYKAEWDKLRNN